MKNFKSNLKGFTLVELIVVMAIIGVLAAVLVPGLLGYMKDSRISQANSNAHTVYTAISSWHAKEVAANGNATAFAGHNTSVQVANAGVANPVNFTVIGGVTPPNMRDKVGESFRGSAYVAFSADGGGVSYALWQADAGAVPALAGANNGQYTAADQDAFGNNNIVGCSPLA